MKYLKIPHRRQHYMQHKLHATKSDNKIKNSVHKTGKQSNKAAILFIHAAVHVR